MIWHFLLQQLHKNIPCVLLYVLQSKGSSPGRQGFRMAVSANGALQGSIGGGIMEHKMVEKAKDMLAKKEQIPFFKPQIHHKKTATNQSGMICSGEQFLVLYPLYPAQKNIIQNILNCINQKKSGIIQLFPSHIEFSEQTTPTNFSKKFTFHNTTDWLYQEQLGYQHFLHIIGGGHVGLALSRQIFLLTDIHITLYDDRPELITMERNTYAHQKVVLPYEKIGEKIPEGEQHFVVIMTFGYRSDKLILRQLYQKQFAYIGMMGSATKIQQLFKEYQQEGITAEQLQHVYAPIGFPIFSRTPSEIAVSIAAQIITVKNQHLPKGNTSAMIQEKYFM